jgi:ABC-type branched-subunit amino acid transport system substrate-binding protein/predicted negative regulator of RcsB-dependent stress response
MRGQFGTRKSMTKKIFAVMLFILQSFTGWSQVDYPKQYQNAKDLFRQGKYSLAMETFKPLIAYDQQNPYSAYASFYYAIAAHKQGYNAVAKDMFLQIKKVHPKWDKMEEVNLWLGKIYMADKDYFQGMKILGAIADKKLTPSIQAIKEEHLADITDTETLSMMHEDYPKDEVVGKYLAQALSKDISDEEDKQALEALIGKFKFERADFIPEAPKTFHKERYTVSLLLPFMLESLDASPGRKRNWIVLDFYEGIKLALDTLNSKGPQIQVRAYDTETGLDNLKKLLLTDELKNTDLVMGPLYPNENQVVQEFSIANQVNVVNPFSNNTDLIGSNPYAYLFQPSSESIGEKAAAYMAERSRKKVCMVFAGAARKDSVLAANFTQKAEELGMKIVVNRSFPNPKEQAAEIMNILATATEFDEFKFPSQFTVAKDSIGSIFVATDDPLIYTKVISAIETRGDSIMVVGSENWIDDTAVAFEKFQTLGVSFTAPNFVAVNNPRRKAFMAKYLRKYGKVPSNISQLGYEMMLFFGNQLKTNGVYFQDGLNNAEVIPGHLFQGFNYQYSRDNQLVPFVKFRNGVLSLVETK